MSSVNPMLEDNEDEGSDDSVAESDSSVDPNNEAIVVNPLLGDDDDDLDELVLPSFDDDDFLSILDDATENSVGDGQMIDATDDGSYPVNYDDYVQMDIDRGVREADDGVKSFEDSFNSVLNPSANEENYDNYESSDDGSLLVDPDSVVGENERSEADDNFAYESDDFSTNIDDSRSALLSMYEDLNSGESADTFNNEDDSNVDGNGPVYSTSSDSYSSDTNFDSDIVVGSDDNEVSYDEDEPVSSLDAILQIQKSLEEGTGLTDDNEDNDNEYASASMFYHGDEDEENIGAHQLDVDAVITLAIDMNASDIDLIPNDEVTFTILGDIRRIPEFGIITSRQIANTYRDITTSVSQDDFLKFPDMDTSYEVRRGKYMGRRLRLSVGKTFDSHFMVFRVISNNIPSPADIGMDQRLLNWSTLPNGLILINGPTGVGKSTTLASLIREIQVKRSDKIITIEKPVEYVYGIAGRSSVTQREVGRDTASFAAGLDGAMRQHPDVILIGEVRNQEEINAVLYAAETGHLAFSTMHTNSASHTLNRIKRLFKGEEQVRILGDLSEVVRGLSNQLLVRSPDGVSRSSVNEVLEVDDTVKDLILEGDVRGISRYQEETGTTMEHELVKAIQQDRCDISEARRVTSFRPRLDKILKGEGMI